MAKVLTFHIAYEGMENDLWRDVEVSSKYRLDQLGYVILTTFDTLAYHLFEIQFRGEVYALPDEDNPPIFHDLADYTLESLNVAVGETMEMVYDFGTEQHFLLTLTDNRDMKRGEGTHYPWIAAMQGRGIIDDLPAEELAELVQQIRENGKTDEPIYYHRGGTTIVPWDFNRYDLKSENVLLKGETERTARGYAPFWNEDLRRNEKKVKKTFDPV